MYLLDAFQTFAQSAAPAAITSLWQGLAVAAALVLGLRLAPRITAAQRFLVWSAGFAVVAALPFLPVLTFTRTAAQVASPTPSAAWFELGSRWPRAIAALWLAASLFRIADLLLHVQRLRRLWRSASPVETACISRAQVCTTPHLDRPSVIGFFAPRILIPEWLFARLTAGELEQIVLHESEHLRRRDDWTNLAQKLLLAFFPLNAALVWIDRRLAREREMACDEGVIRITQAPRAYAACLTSLAERGLSHRTEALSLGAWQRRPELVQRVHSILRGRRALHPIAARAVFASLACGLGLLSFELAQCPQLVAFASAAPQPVQMAAAGEGDAVYTPGPRLESGLRAVPAKAVMPMIEAQPLMHHRAVHHRKPAEDAQPAAPQAEQIAAALQPAQPQQVIVFTEWEQIETVHSPSAHVAAQSTADYETGQAADAVMPSSAQPAPPATQTASRIRITQLVLKVLPAGSAKASTSKLHQPAAVLLGNGWFVIQL
ncbi:MAG TPA: M56 family metallopeptidase [Terracidiphilus sp.]|nr:M56 family metallopeptidase [Terracidiphilus sp.]